MDTAKHRQQWWSGAMALGAFLAASAVHGQPVSPNWDYANITGGMSVSVSFNDASTNCFDDDFGEPPTTPNASNSISASCPGASSSAGISTTESPPGSFFSLSADADAFGIDPYDGESGDADASVDASFPFTVDESGLYQITFDYDTCRINLHFGTVAIVGPYGEQVEFSDFLEDTFETITIETYLAAATPYALLVSASADAPEMDHGCITISSFSFLRVPPVIRTVPSGTFPTITDAIDASSTGDIILLQDGVYFGNGNFNLRIAEKTITLRSMSGDPEACRLDAQGADGFERWVIEVAGDSIPNMSVIEGITISGGYLDGSGASSQNLGGGVDVRFRLCAPTFRNCIFRDNEARAGSAIEIIRDISSGTGSDLDFTAVPTFESCVVTDNYASGTTANTYHGGAAVYLRRNSFARFINCTITDNLAEDSGGGFASDDDAAGHEVTLQNTILLDNTGNQGLDDIDLDANCTVTFACSIYDPAQVGGGTAINTSESFLSNPLFCDAAGDDYTLCATSPALPVGNDCGGTGELIGARGVGGCGACGVIIQVPGLYPTIQSAVDAVQSGDRIRLTGTLTGPGNRNVRVQDKSIRIESSSGPDACIVDLQGSSGNQAFGIEIEGAASSGTIISGITFRNGYWNNAQATGGALDISDADPVTIDNCRFESNTAGAGGALEIQDGASVTVSGCSLLDNQALSANPVLGAGGAIFVKDATASFVDCVIADNHATQLGGGAAWLRSTPGRGLITQVDFSGCTITGNTAAGPGGAIHAVDSGTITVTLDDTILWGNESSAPLSLEDAFIPTAASLVADCSMVRRSRIGGGGTITVTSPVSGPPRFCDARPPTYDFQVASNSRATPALSECGRWIGAVEATCGTRTFTFDVRADGNGVLPFIVPAIAAAVDGDTIALAPGRYTGPSNHNLVIFDKTLTLRGTSDDPDDCILDGGGIDNTFGVIIEGENVMNRSVVENITLKKFRASGAPESFGGGIEIRDDLTDVTVRNCKVDSTRALSGAAVEINLVGSALFESCWFTNNTATSVDDGGGAVLLREASQSVRFVSCVFGNNSSTGPGGAVFARSAASVQSLEFDRCTLADNASLNGANAFYFTGAAIPLELTDTIVYSEDPNATGVEISGDGSSSVTATCCLLDPTMISGVTTNLTNVSADDPLFCVVAAEPYAVCDDSPALPVNNPDCSSLIGAVSTTCPACGSACSPPPRPGLPDVTAVCGGVYVAWNAVVGADQYGVFMIRPSSSPELVGTVPGTGTLAFLHEDPILDSRDYEIQAFAGVCSSMSSPRAPATPFERPIAPLVRNVTSECEGIGLEWSRVGSAAAYRVYLTDGGSPSFLAEVPQTTQGVSPMFLHEPGDLVRHDYVITAVVQDSCESSQSSGAFGTATAPPVRATNVNTTTGCDSVLVAWTSSPADSFHVFLAVTSGDSLIGRPGDLTEFLHRPPDDATYQYRVSTWENGCESPLTDPVPGSRRPVPSPVLSAPDDEETDVAQPVTLAWAEPRGDVEISSFTVQLATSTDFANDLVWERRNLDPSLRAATVEVLLDPQTPYTWRVIGNTTCGAGPSIARAFATGDSPVEVEVDASAATGATLRIIDQTGNLTDVFGRYRLGGDTGAMSVVPFEEPTPGTFETSVQEGADIIRGLEYVLTLDFGGTEIFAGSIAEPEEIATQVRDARAPFQTGNEYRMVAVPMENVDGAAAVAAIIDEFGAESNENWKVRRYTPTGTDAGGYDPFGSAAPPDLLPGEAYWLITKGSGSWPVAGDSHWPDMPDTFTVVLLPGWNMVGNPAGYAVSLDHDEIRVGMVSYRTAKNTNLVDPDIWVYEPRCQAPNANGHVQTNSSTGTLPAWGGCWVHNISGGPLVLKLPAREVGATDPCGSAPVARQAVDASGWELLVTARTGGERSDVKLRIGGEARDVPLPPADPGRRMRISLHDPDRPANAPTFMDVKEPGDRLAWTVEIENPGGSTELSWSDPVAFDTGLEVGDVVLVENGRRWRMDDVHSITLGPGRHELIVSAEGTYDASTARGGLWVIARPNPFKTETGISYHVPGPGRAVVKAFDVVGRRVWEETFHATEAGGRALVWDGANLAGEPLSSGTYFLRVEFDPTASEEQREVARYKFTIVR